MWQRSQVSERLKANAQRSRVTLALYLERLWVDPKDPEVEGTMMGRTRREPIARIITAAGLHGPQVNRV